MPTSTLRKTMPRKAGAWNGSPTISVVIPTLNEAKNLPRVLQELPSGLHEVIVVDGGSTDDTVTVARYHRPDVTILVQGGRGKGNALALGLTEATGDIVVMLDADGSTDPREITAFVMAMVESGADVVKGTRFASDGGSEDITPLRAAGNRALLTLANWAWRTRHTDLCYGYLAFRREAIPRLALDTGRTRPRRSRRLPLGDGFEIETLLVVRAAAVGLRVVEVPSVERVRWHGTSNLRTFRDGWRVLRTMFREKVSPAVVPSASPFPALSVAPASLPGYVTESAA